MLLTLVASGARALRNRYVLGVLKATIPRMQAKRSRSTKLKYQNRFSFCLITVYPALAVQIPELFSRYSITALIDVGSGLSCPLEIGIL
jgi:hypothetical protein